MSKESRTFEIRFQNNKATITTDQTRIGTLETLIQMIFHEFHRKKPEEFDNFMSRLNLLHEFTKERREEMEGDPIDDSGSWKPITDNSD